MATSVLRDMGKSPDRLTALWLFVRTKVLSWSVALQGHGRVMFCLRVLVYLALMWALFYFTVLTKSAAPSTFVYDQF